jgi:hypothetical protein
LLLLAVLSFSNNAFCQTNKAKKHKTTKQIESVVYVCNNGKTLVYHVSSGCAALGRCRSGVSKLSISEAKSSNLRVCKRC